MKTPSSRIDVADALRGFSIFAIAMLHSIEHFNCYSFPEATSEWLRICDSTVWDLLFFLFAGKAYAIFALLFGFSFFIQNDNQERRGNDFRPRFAWRLLLLFVWGNINAIFFTGEILVTFALMGLVLIPISHLKNRTLGIIAMICLLQPYEWFRLIYALLHPDYIAGASLDAPFWPITMAAQQGASFLEMAKVNLWEGQLASLAWAWENGRFFQIIALFIFGLLIGRTRFFEGTDEHLKRWKQILIVSILCFVPLYALRLSTPTLIDSATLRAPLTLIAKSLSDFAFMLFLMSSVVLAYYKTARGQRWLGKLIPIGRMSLTAYITQSIIGSFLFYHWGLGLYNTLGVTASLGVGILIFLLQCAFANRWMKHHKQGPLEYIWKKATWIGAKR